jgi:hypothetical protein
MKGMTSSQIPLRNKNLGNPGNGGEFAGHDRAEADVTLVAESATPRPLFEAEAESDQLSVALGALGASRPGSREFEAAYLNVHLVTAQYEKAAGVVDGVHPPKDLEPQTIAAAGATQREAWAKHPLTAIRLAVAQNPRTRLATVQGMQQDRDFHIQDAAHIRLHGVASPGNAHKREYEERTGLNWHGSPIG